MPKEDGSEQSQNVWPLPAFFFSVEITDVPAMSFKEVSGLNSETEVIEYRNGDSKVFSKAKMPGLKKSGNITLKKGIFVSDQKFWNWYKEIQQNTIKRRTVTIKLLDQAGTPAMVWEVTNAWPTKITVEGFKSDGNEVALETLELAHEGLILKA